MIYRIRKIEIYSNWQDINISGQRKQQCSTYQMTIDYVSFTIKLTNQTVSSLMGDGINEFSLICREQKRGSNSRSNLIIDCNELTLEVLQYRGVK